MDDNRVMCREHLQTYDPRTEPGCQVCREGRGPQEAAGVPWGKLALAMVAMLIVSTFLVSVERTGTSAEEPNVLQMQAHPFKDPIGKMEYVLYASGSEGASDALQIVSQARRLARDMQEWESRLSMTPYIVDIRDFADFVEARAESGFDDEALTDCRLEWGRVRAHVFGPEDWFLTW